MTIKVSKKEAVLLLKCLLFLNNNRNLINIDEESWGDILLLISNINDLIYYN